MSNTACVIPSNSALSGWKTVRLDQVATVQTGVAVSSQAERVDPIRLPYLRVANVQDGHIDLSELKHITVSRNQVARYLLQPGDVLMTEGGDFDKLGRGAVWHGEVETCLHQNHVFAVRPDPAKLLPAFLAAYCESPLGKRYFLSCSKQTTNLASINSTQVKEMPMTIPPLAQQERIVTLVATWDTAIDTVERLISAKLRAHEDRVSQLIPESCGGRSPEWQTRPLHDLGDVVGGGTPPIGEPAYWNGGIPWITPSEVSQITDPKVARTERTISQLGLKNSSAELLAAGSLIVCTRATIGACCINSVPMATNQGFKSIVPNAATNVRYLYHAVSARQKDLMRLANGSTFLEISKAEFENIQIAVPPLETQTLIADLLDAEETEISLLRKDLILLETQKRGLMQRLASGEWLLDERFDLSGLAAHVADLPNFSTEMRCPEKVTV